MNTALTYAVSDEVSDFAVWQLRGRRAADQLSAMDHGEPPRMPPQCTIYSLQFIDREM